MGWSHFFLGGAVGLAAAAVVRRKLLGGRAVKVMSDEWRPEETGTHQDHVIAHVVAWTVLG